MVAAIVLGVSVDLVVNPLTLYYFRLSYGMYTCRHHVRHMQNVQRTDHGLLGFYSAARHHAYIAFADVSAYVASSCVHSL
jgi:hypothetical protein